MLEKFFNRFSTLRGKLIVIFIIVIIFPFLFSGIVTYYKYTGSVEEEARHFSDQLTAQINTNLDNYLSEINRLTYLPMYDEDVLNILRDHEIHKNENRFVPSSVFTKITLFLSSMAVERPEIKEFLILANDGSIFSNSDEQIRKRENRIEHWKNQVLDTNRNISIIPWHVPDYYGLGRFPISDKADLTVFSVIRDIRDPMSGMSLGLIKVDITRKAFEKILSFGNSLGSSKLFITDNSGKILYPEDNEKNNIDIPLDHKVEIDGIVYLASKNVSAYTGINVIGLINEKELKKDALDLIRFNLLLSCIALVASIFMAAFFSSHIVRPLKHLQKSMARIHTSNFDVYTAVNSRDEIGQLSQGFNMMVDKIKSLINEVYIARIREKEAELSALQSQINPHFLYNTFELVNMIAMENNQYEICDIISSLGRLFRYTVNKQEKPVLLIEEIRFVKAYLKIVSFRYGKRLKTVIATDPYLESCLVPKLILQPLVENAIQHGIKENRGSIAVKICRNDPFLLIHVEDDGKGINEYKLKQLEAKIYNKEINEQERESFGEKRKGYALRNLHQRIRLLYGDEYGLTISSQTDRGSCFTLKLPMVFAKSVEG